MLNQNIQPGFGLTQVPQIDATLPDEFHELFRDEQLCGTDLNFHQIYMQNFHRIRDTENPQPTINNIPSIPQSIQYPSY